MSVYIYTYSQIHLLVCLYFQVIKKSKAEDVGLKRGDQILEVNGQSFEHVSHSKALEILRGTTHLSITVKSNLLGMYCNSITNFVLKVLK